MIKFNLLKILACKFSKIFSISQNNSTKSPFTLLFDAIKPVNGYLVTGGGHSGRKLFKRGNAVFLQ